MNNKILSTVICLVLVATALFSFVPVETGEAEGTRASSSIVFGEDGTATWCQYCPAASEELLAVESANSNFRFVCLVDDMTQAAADRTAEYAMTSYPTVYFDGGYESVSGGQSDTTNYDAAISSCDSRTTADLTVSPTAVFQGNGEIDVNVDITNNGASSFSGTLKVYVVEMESRYIDYDGLVYPNALLDFAIDKSVSIPASGMDQSSATWEGANVNDLLGNDFSDIDKDNIMIYAVVFSSEGVEEDFGTINPLDDVMRYYMEGFGEAELSASGEIPEVTITAPSNGASVSENATITATVSSTLPITGVTVRIGAGSWMAMTESSSVYSYTWDTTASLNGNIKIFVNAVNNQSKEATSSIEVKVSNAGALEAPEIISISFNPTSPTTADDIIVSVVLEPNDAIIASVKVVICEGDLITGDCYPPVNANYVGSNTYEADIGDRPAGELHATAHVAHNIGDEVTDDAEVTVATSDADLPEVTSVSFNPASPTTDDEVTVTATIESNAATITRVQIVACDPSGACLLAVTLSDIGSDKYEGQAGPYPEGDMHISVEVTYSINGVGATLSHDAGDVTVTDSASSGGGGSGGSSLTADDIGTLMLLVFVAIFVLIAVVIVRKNR